MYCLLSGFFQSTCFWNSTILLHVISSSFLLLHCIVFCDYITVCLSKLLDTVEGIWVASSLILLWIILLRIFLYMSFGDCKSSYLFGICTGIELLVYRIGMCWALALVHTATKFSKVVVSMNISYMQCMKVWNTPHSCQLLVLYFLVFQFYIF